VHARAVASAVAAALSVAACTGEASSVTTSAGPTPSVEEVPTTLEVPTTTDAPIAHPSGEHDVVVQIGAYDLGNNIDEFVRAPSVVVYGNGDAYGYTYDQTRSSWRPMRRHVPEAELQRVLSAGRSLPSEVPAAQIPADDTGTFVAIGERSWLTYPLLYADSDPFRQIINDVLAVVDAEGVDTWQPSAWIVRPNHGPCSVQATAPDRPSDGAPVYPHLADRYPLGETSCTTPDAGLLLPDDPRRVILQVGEYVLGRTIPDHYVEGPTVVVYGDLRVFGLVSDGSTTSWASGHVSLADVVALLRRAAMLPDTAPDGSAREAVDDFGTMLMVGGRRWRTYPPGLVAADPFVALLEEVDTVARRALTDPWTPAAWIEQPERNGPCVVVEQPDVEPWLAAPVYPHLTDRYPTGPASCDSPG